MVHKSCFDVGYFCWADVSVQHMYISFDTRFMLLTNPIAFRGTLTKIQSLANANVKIAA